MLNNILIINLYTLLLITVNKGLTLSFSIKINTFLLSRADTFFINSNTASAFISLLLSLGEISNSISSTQKK
jgi:hypothetical protein